MVRSTDLSAPAHSGVRHHFSSYRNVGTVATLATTFDPRVNSLNALRLILAAAVLLSHGTKFAGANEDPLGRLTGTRVDIGTIAVDGFFVLSGFLISRSYVSSPSLPRFLWRRCLRVLPGFWVCLVVTALVFAPAAAFLEHGRPGAFNAVSGPDSALSYVVRNAGLHISQFSIGGILNGQPINGSLHTLFYEFLCYLLVAGLGVLGVLQARTVLVVFLAGAVFLLAAADLLAGSPLTTGHPGRQLLLRFGAMFLVGACCALYARHVRFRPSYGVAAVALLVAAIVWSHAWILLAPPALAYVLLWLGTGRSLSAIGSRRDLSYGLYVYAWPTQALLLSAGATRGGLLLYTGLSLAAALGLALLSWHAVEAPALALKGWNPPLVRRARQPAGEDVSSEQSRAAPQPTPGP